MITDIKINKPEPITISEKQKYFKQGDDVRPIIKELTQGRSILIEEFYSDGISLLPAAGVCTPHNQLL